MISTKLLLITLFSFLATVSSAHGINYPRNRTHSYCPGHHVSEHHKRKLFNDFVNVFYKQKDVPDAYNTFVAEDLIEHNPFTPDGREAGIAALTGLIAASDIELVHVLFDGCIGAVHSMFTLPGQPFLAIADFFRYDGSCIVEHWDVSESVPANATNPHPLF
jgi:predicted SnoaL-like aldol condensation-catalyzing enzyme